MSDYYILIGKQSQRRDEVWPFSDDWGEIRQKVRDYLKREWEAHIDTERVKHPTLKTTRNEARDILEVCVQGHITQ